VDSILSTVRTTVATIASQLATEYRIPSIDRKVFLDNEQTTGAIQEQFRRLLDIARRQGTALGIGPPCGDPGGAAAGTCTAG
jgi:polysaccharide deacetylase 2 family uncharacterized protein YibQ